MSKPSQLTVVNCNGCGACCFHMGYPAFVVPRDPMTEAEIEADADLRERADEDKRFKQDLLDGHPGESYWHSMPDDLKEQWQAYVDNYQQPAYDGTVEGLDGPCFWLDMETRQCTNHEYRPNICRDFKAASPGCYDWRTYYADLIKVDS